MNNTNLRDTLLKNFFGRLLLRLVAFFYGLGVKLNLYLYKKEIRKKKEVASYVICVGNITAGGTGKTPTVLLAARLLADMKVRSAVVSRGYKRPDSKEDIVILSDKKLANWEKSGDEPYMMHLLLKDYKIPVIVGVDRYQAVVSAIHEFDSKVILLDDGFQHHKLKRDINIVLIDAKNPFGNNALLPFGTLREPLTALKRADLVLITHSDLVDKKALKEIKDQIAIYNKAIPALEATHKPKYFYDLNKNVKVDLKDIKGDVVSFCAVGDPASFEQTLKNLGLHLKQTWRFPDHALYTLEQMETFANLRQGLPLITTFKDYVKLPQGWQEVLKEKVYMLEIEMSLEDKDLEIFKKTITPKVVERHKK